MMRVQTGQQTFYVELQPLRAFPVADITCKGVFIRPAVVFWPRWLISDGDAELAMVVKVEEAARAKGGGGQHTWQFRPYGINGS
jgi:hypothetical protein